MLRRLTSRQGTLLTAGASVLLALVAVVLMTLHGEYNREVRDVLLHGTRTAQKLALHTNEIFDRANQTTLLVKHLSETRHLPPLGDMRQAGVLANDVTRVVLITDARGFVVDGTSDQIAINLADEDDFKAHKARGDLDVTIGPAAPSHLAGGHAIPVTRRLQTPEQDFAGVVMATVDPLALTGSYGKTEAADTAVGVVGLDGVYRSRVVGGRVSVGDKVDVAALEKRAREVLVSQRPSRSPIDGVERFVSLMRVEQYPLLAVVAINADTALAGYYRTRRTVLGWAGAIVALVLLAGGAMYIKVQALARSDAKLAELSERLQDLYEHAPCGYYSLDANGKFVQINTTALTLLGCEHRREVIGELGPLDFFTPQGQAEFRALFPVFMQEGRIGPLEFDLLARNGSCRRVSVAATAVYDASGQFVRSRSVMHDISELDGVRRLLQQANREQQAMLDSDIVGIVKLKNRLAVWKNRALDRMFGYQPGELGPSARDLYLDEASYQALGAAAYPVLQQGGHFRTQLQMRRKDGEAMWVDMSGVMLSRDSGETMWMMLDITAMKRQQELVEKAASHDSLTGLPNRALLMDRLRQNVPLAQRTQTTLAVCFIDLDGFKAVNDTHGHAAGDVLLQAVAARLLECVRGNDTVARLGGDEFVVVLTQLHGRDECEAVLARIRQAVQMPVTVGDGHGVGVGVGVGASIGVAYCPHDGIEAEQLLKVADAAMYRVKQGGRVVPAHEPAAMLALPPG